ncbi:MAG: tetratricopeptide repeat protein [Chthoniobacter sp.]|nr:tetratricopeptide repeat protein [Chthoniobacter sp.]
MRLLPSSFACPPASPLGRAKVLAVVALVVIFGSVTGALGQAPAAGLNPVDMEAVALAVNEAQKAFEEGRWAEAAAGFEAAAKMIPDERAPQHPPLLYMIGAAYFNAGDNGKAIETFKKYITKYPNAEKIWEIKLGLARATFRAKNYAEAIPLFKELEPVAIWRDESLLSQAESYRATDKLDDAITALVRLITPDIRNVAQAGGAVTLAELYAEKKDSKKAVIVLQRLEIRTSFVENPIGLNAVAVKLGDGFLEDKQYADSLAAYRTVLSRETVLRIQKARISRMEAIIEANTKAATGNPQLQAQVQMLNTQIKDQLDPTKKQLEEFEKLPDFGPGLLLRMGRAYYEWNKRWEAVVVYQKLLDQYPSTKDREGALFGQVVAYADLLQPRRCQVVCDQYFKEFPEGPSAGTVGYMAGAVAMQVLDFVGAEKTFVRMLEKVPNSEFKEEMRYLLGNSRFMQGKFEAASKDYASYLADYPNGERFDEVGYRQGLCAIFSSDYDKATTLLGDFVKKNPQGPYTADARYRLMVCKYAKMKYEDVIADGAAWVTDFAGNAQEGEVQALLGDCFAAVSKTEEAVKAYERSYKVATTDEVLNYSLFETSKHLQKLGKWPEVTKMFEEFVKEKPSHPAVITAMFWIAKSRAKQGQTEEAKTFLVETLKQYIAEPKREAVEPLLQQLAQLCAKRPRPKTPPPEPTPPAAVKSDNAPAPVAATSAPVAATSAPVAPSPATPADGTPAAAPATPPPLPPYDAYAELEKQLAPLEKDATITTKARLLYTKSELARAIRKPADADAIYLEMSARFKPADLSPYLLAVLGDFLMFRGDQEKAGTYFNLLKEDFLKSDYLDYAYVGLGEIALNKKEYDKALELFTDALDKIGASSKLKEATIGKAQALLALKKFPESKKLFEQVASVREWRGESTAQAVYSIGQIEAQQGNYAEAIAFYRRVFIAYQKQLPWVAKSYIGVAESFDKWGKRQDAVENLREMLRKPNLEKFPETEQARRMLITWGVSL